MSEDNGFMEKLNTTHIDTQKVVKWYVMRDLKRPNAKSPAYKVLEENKMEVFTPLVQKLNIKNGTKVRELVPFIPDLLFVHTSKETLDSFVLKIPTLQYRYVRGGKYKEAMTVDETSMNQFISAIRSSTKYQYYQLTEIPAAFIGSLIRIVGGFLDGCEGYLLKVRGSKRKRLLVKIENLMAAAFEVESEYIQIVQ
jgi:hypothetical protein